MRGTLRQRPGAGLPHAWFCYLWHDYVPGSREQSENVLLASCARCGHVMPRDPWRAAQPCNGVVRVELRATRRRIS